jgi:hypothetical protein
MAKAKSTTNPADSQVRHDSVEPMVIALAEQLGTFLGRVQAKADGWLDNDALREQVAQIRDGAANLLSRVNRAGAAAGRGAAAAAPWTRLASAIASRHRSRRSTSGWASRPARRRARNSSRWGRVEAAGSAVLTITYQSLSIRPRDLGVR